MNQRWSSMAIGIAVLLSVLRDAAADEAWQPANPRLMTEWGEKVRPDNAWSEYPRPQFVRDRWMNLNGLWNYSIQPKAHHKKAVAFDKSILVPFAVESSLSGAGKPFMPEDVLWY